MRNTFKEIFKDRYKLLLIGILFLSVGLRSVTFLIPHNGFDEAIYLKLGEKVYHNPFDYTLRGTDIFNYKINVFGQSLPVPKYYNEPLYHIPPLFVYMISISYHIFGLNVSSAVLVSFLFGSISCIVVYLIGAKLFNKKVAMLASFLNAVSSVHWIGSTKIWNDAVLAFFVALTFYLFYLGIEDENIGFIFLAGVFQGLALLIKQSAILVFPALLFYLIVTKKTLKAILNKKVALFLLVSSFILLPWLVWVKSVYGVPWHMPQQSSQIFMANNWFVLLENRPIYYLFISIPLTVPFYFFSYMGFATLKRDNSFNLLFCWFLTFIIFFSIYPRVGELRFLIPTIPALDIMASAYFVDKIENLKGQSSKIIIGLLSLSILFSLSVGVLQILNNVDLLGVLFWI